MIVAGPGNNGGDGFVAARHLAERGYAVRVSFVGEPKRLKGDAALAADRWSGPVEAGLADFAYRLRHHRRCACSAPASTAPVEGLPRAMIAAMNASGVPVIAVDLPSGINGTTGARDGGRGQRPRDTVTFFRRKTGHVLLPGRLHCGVDRGRRYRHSRTACWRRSSRDFRATRRRLWGRSFPRPSRRRPQIFARPRGGGVRRPIDTPGRRGWRRVARCGQGQGLSPSPARARRSPSMPRPAWRSWCGRSMGQASSPSFLPTGGATRWCWARAAGSAQPCGSRSGRRSPANAAVVLDADALTSFAEDAGGAGLRRSPKDPGRGTSC